MIFVLVHVVIAISSLISTSILAFIPSRFKLKLSYYLIATTLASGTLLVVITRQPILHSCLAGLVYLMFAMSGVVAGNRRLAT
jgi:hypothetical protein